MDNLVSLDDGGKNKKATLELIRKVGFLDDLEPDEITIIADWAKAYSAEAGDIIFKEGSDKTNLCFLIEGQISISKQVSPFESISISEIDAGGVIGEIGIIDGEPISASAKAIKNSVVVVISGEDFEKLVRQNGDLGAKLLWKIGRIITSRLRQTTALMADLSMSKSSRMLKY